MFKLLSKWVKLSRTDRFLYIKIFCWLGIIRAFIIILPFKWIAGHLGQQGMESPYVEGITRLEASQHLGRSIETVSHHTWWDSKCLVQAITGKILLRKQGIGNTLYLGIRKNEKNELIAHAWLRVGPTVITGELGRREYIELSRFGDCHK